MAWIKMDHWLEQKREVIQIAEELGISRLDTVGRLYAVWCWFDRETTDGNAASVTKSALDSIIQHEGFANAMEKAGWLSCKKRGISIPNFERHNGKSAKRRALTAERVRNKRNAPSVTRALPDKSKRREEDKKERHTHRVSQSETVAETGEGIDWAKQLTCWNYIATEHGLRKARVISGERKKRLRAQFKRHGDSKAFWTAVHEACRGLGSWAKDRGFVTLDFVSYQGRCQKLLEGNYQEGKRPASSRTSSFNREGKFEGL